MTQLQNETFVCMDCETTGLDVQQDRIIEVAAVKFNFSSHLSAFEALVDPECEVPESSIEIHHITPDMLVGKPKISAVLPELLSLIGNHTIVGHGIAFDIDMVVAAAERAGIPCPIKKNKTLDTLRMARLYGESPINSLEQLRCHFNIPYEIAHRAMSDVVVNVEVFKFLAKKYKSSKQIHEALERPILLKVMPLGPHKGRSMREVPVEYLRWASNKDFDIDFLYSVKHELKRRKQGGLFSQAGNPFSDL